MERVHYVVTPPEGKAWETTDFDIAKTSFEKGCLVVEFKEYLTYSEFSSVRLTISTQLTSSERI